MESTNTSHESLQKVSILATPQKIQITSKAEITDSVRHRKTDPLRNVLRAAPRSKIVVVAQISTQDASVFQQMILRVPYGIGRQRLRYNAFLNGMGISVRCREDVLHIEGRTKNLIPIRFTSIRVEAIDGFQCSVTAY